MQVRRVLALLVAILFVSVAAPLVAQRNNDNNKQPQRSPGTGGHSGARPDGRDRAAVRRRDHRPASRLAATGDAAHCEAADAGCAGQDRQGDMPIKWDSNHFVKGQTDTYIPFTLQLDRRAVPAGAALYDSHRQRRTGGGLCDAGDDSQRQRRTTTTAISPPARPTFAWDNGSFVDVPDGGKLQRAIQLRPGQYVAYIAVKEKSAAAPAAISATTIATATIATPPPRAGGGQSRPAAPRDHGAGFRPGRSADEQRDPRAVG